MSDWASYVNLFGDHGPGCAVRTLEIGPDMHVDLDAQDRIIGVEMLGENQDWTAALTALAMQGRLTVPRP